MAVYRDVLVQWHDEPDEPFVTTVSVDEVWNGIDEDDGIFFYFANENEFQQATQSGDNGYEFRIMSHPYANV